MSGLHSTLSAVLTDRYAANAARVRELAVPLSNSQFWQKPFPYGNSFGHLVLHLTGNLNYYVGAQIAQTGYVRDRPREFNDPNPPSKEEALQHLDEAVAMVQQTIRSQSSDDWSRDYSGVGTAAQSRLDMIMQCAAHMQHHIGQMIYLLASGAGKQVLIQNRAKQPLPLSRHLSAMQKQQSRSLLVLAGFGVATAGAAWYGARYSRNGSRDFWYRDLDKPIFTPPDAVFPVVWTALYAMIAWSGWRIWSAAPSRHRNAALRLWISQLLANARWSKLFFGEHRPRLALGDIVALEGTITSYIAAARKVDRAAANAFIPYAAWVAFATVLNAEIVRLNPQAR